MAQELPLLVGDMLSNNLQRQVKSTTRIRNLLSVGKIIPLTSLSKLIFLLDNEENPPIHEIINANLVPRLVQFLAEESEMLQAILPRIIFLKFVNSLLHTINREDANIVA